jgi:hypothetical protein
MAQSNLPNVSSQNFAATVTSEGTRLTVKMTGNWDMNAVAFFDEFVRALESEASRRAAAEVIIHVGEVEFITSSCFKSFVRWFAALRRLPPAHQYHIKFYTNTKLPWQRRSLEPLVDLGEGRVAIES